MRTVDEMLRKTESYTDAETGETFELPYRVFFPTDYTATGAKRYPMLFFLHGHGECGTDNELQIRVLKKENRLLDLVVARDDCIVVAPQCPCNVKYEWVPLCHAWSTGSRELTEKPTVGLAAAMQLLDRFLTTEAVDRTRVYAAGISMGGYGMWELVTRRTEVFAAAVPVCGAGIPSMAKKLVDLPVWAFHGAADGTVPVSGARDMVAAIHAAGGDKIRYNEYPNVGHDCWIPAYREAGLVEWLFEQKKA